MVYRKSWEVPYQRDRAAGRRRYLDASATRAHLAHFVEAGAPLKALARATGLSDTAVKAILDGDHTTVQATTAARVNRLTLTRLYSDQATGHLPRLGAARRVQALLAIGWRHQDLAAAGATGTPRILNCPGHLVTATTWRQVRDVYDQLCMTHGPSATTRQTARARGYPPPLAWDDQTIDDPRAEPAHAAQPRACSAIDPVAVDRAIHDPTTPVELNEAERLAVIRAMSERGATDTTIGTRTGTSPRTVLRLRQAEHIPAGQPATHARSAGPTR